MREAERNIAGAGRASLDLDRLWTKPMTPGTRGKVTVFSTLALIQRHNSLSVGDNKDLTKQRRPR